jgi:hypothetical protein|nr:MAG TPA_asm: hypothetical protein [Caudoviricetes sp.]
MLEIIKLISSMLAVSFFICTYNHRDTFRYLELKNKTI